MNCQEGLSVIQGKIDLVSDILGLNRSGRDKDNKERTAVKSVCDFVGPLISWVNAFVVPNAVSKAMQMFNRWVYNRTVLMTVTNKNERLLSCIGFNGRLRQRSGQISDAAKQRDKGVGSRPVHSIASRQEGRERRAIAFCDFILLMG